MVNMLCVGITFIILLGVALFFHVVVKVTPEEGWASAIMTMLLFVYITGLFGNAMMAFVLLACLFFVGLVYGIYCQYRKAEQRITSFFTPAIVMISGISVFALIAFRGIQLCNWDELYQWGKAANYMVLHDKLPYGADFSGESILLSSTTFSHYIMAKFSYLCQGTITESNYYVSNLILWFSALVLPFSGEGWTRYKETFLYGFFHFLLTAMIFAQPYYNIYTDQATAYWSGAVIAWFLLKKCTRKNIYLLLLILINVGLMKSMEGPLFAVIVIAAVVLLFWDQQKRQGGKVFSREWKRQLFSKKGILLLIAVASPFLLIGIWSILTGGNGLFRFNGGVVNPGEENRLALTVKAMIGWIFKSVNLQQDSLYLSYGFFIILTIGIVYVFYPVLLGETECCRYQFIMKIYILGFVGYFAVMLFAYLKVFLYANSIAATSLYRYYSDYMMLGVVPLTLPFFMPNAGDTDKLRQLLRKGFIMVSCLYILAGSSPYILQKMAHVYAVDKKQYAQREAFEKKAERVRELTNETGKIYFINQKKSGLFTLLADYEMGDQITRGGMCFKFREDTSKFVSGLTDYSIYTLPEVLGAQGYEYVWVFSTNDYLEEKMKGIFGVRVKKGGFYRVVPTETGVDLEYIEKIK